MVVCVICTPSIWGNAGRRIRASESSLASYTRSVGQPGLHKTLSQKTKVTES